jgi:uncharacterized protein YaaW (UPF0174 family)
MAKAIQSLYGMAVGINEYLDKHIEDMKGSDNPTISRTGRVLGMAKLGFGIGYITPVVIISVGQFLLGNTLAAVTTVATAATLTNPVAMTCAAIGAIYYGWSALSDVERNQILGKLSEGLEVGVELIKSMVRFVTDMMNEFSNSQNFKEIKIYIGSAAQLFGKTLAEVTHKTIDRFGKIVDVFGVPNDGRNDDVLIKRLRKLKVNDLRTILTGGLRVDEKAVSTLKKDKLVLLCSKELRAAAGSTTKNRFRGDHDLPYKQILIDVADKLSLGHTPLSWTDYKLSDGHNESDIEDAIASRFEDLAKEWWAKLSDTAKDEFVKGINDVMGGGTEVREVLNSDVVGTFVKQQAVETIIQAGVMHGLTTVASGGVLGALGATVVSQIGWAILLQTVGWMGGMKIAIFGIAGHGALGAAVTGLGSAAIGGALSIPGLLWLVDAPAYRKTIPAVVMLIARHRATLSDGSSGAMRGART